MGCDVIFWHVILTERALFAFDDCVRFPMFMVQIVRKCEKNIP